MKNCQWCHEGLFLLIMVLFVENDIDICLIVIFPQYFISSSSTHVARSRWLFDEGRDFSGRRSRSMTSYKSSVGVHCDRFRYSHPTEWIENTANLSRSMHERVVCFLSPCCAANQSAAIIIVRFRVEGVFTMPMVSGEDSNRVDTIG